MAERAEPVAPARTNWPLLPVLRRVAAMPLKDPFAFTGLLIYVMFALVALFADQLAPVDPLEILFTKAGKLAANVPPSADFPLGTTNLGRDIYAQLVHGTARSGSSTAKAPARPASRPAPAGEGDVIAWVWPANGKVIGTFNDAAKLKGISIAGKLGQPVTASAAGRVIFSGTGIRGFGKLIVIKHNDTFLSVYAHNSELLVKEGQSVAKGQKIAEMGKSDTDQVKLHFEIRRFGKPVDPMTLLPQG